MPIARAVENRCYVLLANAVGSNVGMVSLENSLIVVREDGLVVMADEASETLLTCDLQQNQCS
ncbi:nitrilase-related carbon-nitrogen hydrolase [Moorella sulfitireducens]|uniref:nitrilase-related carbon-nitrogen hydrolase n=1 Tax=Neomoorella sulfitireducens TaxID=2972948 RepID=UPI002413E389|nr:nitrilase-related carbon-nitrogen hydrolase [Moorella sulfitireducens]